MPATVFATIGLPLLIKGISEALSGIKHPAAQGAAAALKGLDDAIARGQITPEQLSEMNRHTEKLEEMSAQERKESIRQVNESLRAEVASSDPYVRRMRPTFGYLIALTWALQMSAIAWVIVVDAAQAPIVINAMASLGTIWAVGLSVLGIYVYKRSEDKKVEFDTTTKYPRTPYINKS